MLYLPISYRPVGTKFILGELKRCASVASKNGGPGACPKENFLWPRPLDRWKTPHFWKICHWQKQRITTDGSLSRKILKFLSCMTSKPIAFLIDSSFLESIWVPIFIRATLAFTTFFTYKINKPRQIIGGAEAPPNPPASDGPAIYVLDIRGAVTFQAGFVFCSPENFLLITD